MSFFSISSPTATAFSGVSQNPISGTFGNGNVQFFTTSQTWTVPTGVTSVRARVWGGGGVGATAPDAGSGGGFAILEITSGLGATVAVTVGAALGTSSFGAFVSATGGALVGGTGSGGDINNTGGVRGGGGSPGGGGAASLLGNGGIGGNGPGQPGGALASGGGGSVGAPGGSGFTGIGGVSGFVAATNNSTSVPQAASYYPFTSIDFIGTGPGGAGSSQGATTSYASPGVNGGGGGGGTATSIGGGGGFPGGGSGAEAIVNARGLVIVEW